MRRDFTEASKNELLGLVDQVESEKWCDVTDWLGDRFLDLRALVGQLSLDNYLNNMGEYHKLVIDKNNTTRDQIERIFANVYAIDSQYVARFAACKARLDQLVVLIDEMAQVIAPTKDGIAIDAARLERAFSTFEMLDASLKGLGPAGEGLTYDALEAMSAEARSLLAERLIGAMVGALPNGTYGEEIEIPVGPGIAFYFKEKAEIDNGSNFDLETAYKDGRIELEKFGYTVSTGDAVKIEGSVSSDGLSSSVSSDHANFTLDDGGMSYSSKWEYGPNTYTYTDGFKLESMEFYTQLSVKTEYEPGSVTTTAGIRSGDDVGWKPVPVYVPAYEPAYEPVSLPSIEIPTWTYVAAAAIVVTAAILLVPETGGASLALCAI